ncbi:helix-turn-helix domain-containing protein [Sinomicrobium oceani]|uniref:helix-turn-helix domain-containing protein n=2 Tax=Sinomicrobium oceani TaxID=1150368 RepID=UPI00227A95D4|nr:helix-turn-helix domain-containing protein [Sinomicrobium oceani]
MHPTDKHIECISYLIDERVSCDLSYGMGYPNRSVAYNDIAMYFHSAAGQAESFLTEHGLNEAPCFLTRLEFVLDQDYGITTANDMALRLLQIEQADLPGLSFEKLLTSSSVHTWEITRKYMIQNNIFPFAAGLTFYIKNHTGYPAYCHFRIRSEQEYPTEYTARNFKPYFIEEFIVQRTPPGKIYEKRDEIISPANYSPDSEKEKIREIIDYIEGHLDEDLPSTDRIAKKFGINREKLRRIFKRFFKVPMYEFYMHKRLKKAMYLLKTTDIPIKEVASAAGFKGPSSFYRAFKLKYHCAPGQMRKKAKKPYP